MEQLVPLNEHSNAESVDFDLPNNITTPVVKALEVKDCAYYIDNLEHITATGYSANTLYFYGY